MHERTHILRLRFVFAIVLMLWLALWARVGFIQGMKSSYYRDLAEGQRVRPITLTAKRGAILDRNGEELAVDVSSASYELRPTDIKDKEKTAALLSGATGMSLSSVRNLVLSKRKYCWLIRQADPDVMRKLDGLSLTGIRKIREYRRYYPYGRVGAQVLGYCDVDGRGIEGCELFANNDLAGRDGRSVALLDALGRSATSLDEPTVEPEDGRSITLTIDRKIQEITDEELDECVSSLNAVWGGAVVLNPETGEILAVSNVPRFNPNDPASYNPDVFDPANRRNRIVTDMIEPGSTFKVVAFSEAFESGLLQEDEPIDCENGKYRIANHTINDSHKLGIVPAREVLVHSSNIGTVKIADRLGKKRLYERARALGFGTVSGIDVPDESKGSLPNPKTWSKLSLPTISFGQGVAVSPIQLAMAYAAIANGGFLLRPYLVKGIAGDEKHSPQAFEKRVIRRAMSEETARRVENLLCEVVEIGTGTTAALPNTRIAGKTGTAQRIVEGGKGYAQGKYISSFIGYVVDHEPKLLCLVMVDSPKGMYYGSQVAGPVFKRIVNRVLNMGDSPVESPVIASSDTVPARKEYSLPDLKGVTIKEALTTLENLGFNPSVVGDSTKVARQMPEAGTVLVEGSRITLYSTAMIMEEGNRVMVPELKGKTVREALQHLSQAQLGVNVSGTGVVSKQVPPPGTLVEHGTICMIICEKR